MIGRLRKTKLIEKKKVFEIEEQGTERVFQNIGFLSINGIKFVYDLKTFEVVGLKDVSIQLEAQKFLKDQKIAADKNDDSLKK